MNGLFILGRILQDPFGTDLEDLSVLKRIEYGLDSCMTMLDMVTVYMPIFDIEIEKKFLCKSKSRNNTNITTNANANTNMDEDFKSISPLSTPLMPLISITPPVEIMSKPSETQILPLPF